MPRCCLTVEAMRSTNHVRKIDFQRTTHRCLTTYLHTLSICVLYVGSVYVRTYNLARALELTAFSVSILLVNSTTHNKILDTVNSRFLTFHFPPLRNQSLASSWARLTISLPSSITASQVSGQLIALYPRYHVLGSPSDSPLAIHSAPRS